MLGRPHEKLHLVPTVNRSMIRDGHRTSWRSIRLFSLGKWRGCRAPWSPALHPVELDERVSGILDDRYEVVDQKICVGQGMARQAPLPLLHFFDQHIDVRPGGFE